MTTHAPPAAGPSSPDYEQRGHRRIDVQPAVAVDAEGLSQISQIVELSRMGARLQVSPMLPLGEEVVLRRGAVALRGRVSWQRGHSVGVGFNEPLDERTFLQLRRQS